MEFFFLDPRGQHVFICHETMLKISSKYKQNSMINHVSREYNSRFWQTEEIAIKGKNAIFSYFML